MVIRRERVLSFWSFWPMPQRLSSLLRLGGTVQTCGPQHCWRVSIERRRDKTRVLTASAASSTSNTVTSWPALESATAAARPAMLPPTTRKWIFMRLLLEGLAELLPREGVVPLMSACKGDRVNRWAQEAAQRLERLTMSSRGVGNSQGVARCESASRCRKMKQVGGRNSGARTTRGRK